MSSKTLNTEKLRATFKPVHDRLKFTHLLYAEFVKLTSLRSTMGLLFAIVGFGLAVSIALGVTAHDAGLPAGPSVDFVLDQVTVGTVLFGQLIAGVLGVLVISGEYSSGTIQPTLLAVPARVKMLTAKAIVLFIATVAAALVSLLSSWFVTYPMLAAFGVEVELTAPGVILALIGGSVYVGLAALLGLGIGAMLRSVAAGVTSVLSIILLLPMVLSVLPASQLVRNLHLLSMSKAGDALVTVTDVGSPFLDLADGYVSAAAGLCIAAAWAGIFLVMGAALLRRRDA